MEKLKDILYDKNDLLVALIILLVAGIIITTRINVIMNYPQTLSGEKQGNVLESDLMNKEDKDSTDKGGQSGVLQGAPDTNPADTDDKNKDSDKKADGNTGAGGTAPAPYSVYVPYGSTPTSIAQTLVDCGLIKNKSDFISAVTAAGADSKLKAGTFTIPADATPEQIVQIIAK